MGQENRVFGKEWVKKIEFLAKNGSRKSSFWQRMGQENRVFGKEWVKKMHREGTLHLKIAH
jgi:hypothetical protein